MYLKIDLKEEHNNWNRNKQVPKETTITILNFGNVIFPNIINLCL